jgi:hypothetical protein
MTTRDKYREAGYQVFIGSSRDNLALSQEYLNDRLAMGEEYVKRYVDAVTWGALEGQIFDMQPDSIVPYSEEFVQRMLRTCKLHRVYDHGDTSPSACLWYATDADENIFVYREYMEGRLSISQHRENIWKISCEDSPNRNELPMYHSNYADPKIFTRDRGRKIDLGPTHSVADEWMDRRIMERQTAISFRRANNNESVTVNRVMEYLRVDPMHRNPFTGEMGAPHLYFIQKSIDHPYGCKEVITDVRAAKREVAGYDNEGNKLYGDKRDPNVRDHCLDCLRYGVATRPALASRAPEAPPEPGTISWKQYQTEMELAEHEAMISGKMEYRGKYNDGY